MIHCDLNKAGDGYYFFFKSLSKNVQHHVLHVIEQALLKLEELEENLYAILEGSNCLFVQLLHLTLSITLPSLK